MKSRKKIVKSGTGVAQENDVWIDCNLVCIQPAVCFFE